MNALSPSPPVVLWRSPFGPERRIPLSGVCLIGRHPAAQIRIDDPVVSLFHCILFQLILSPGDATGSENWHVADLESENGTWLNGARIIRPMPVRKGDVIRIGRTHRIEVLP